MKKRNAFTLAEVLITLGIIGIVAAMTLPIIVENYKRHEYSSKIKKFNSTFTQALVLMEDKYGPSQGWERDDENFVTNMLIPNIKYLRVRRISNNSYNEIWFLDGSIASFASGSCLDMIYDCNGSKKPNTYGADRYDFLICFDDVNRKNFFGNKKKMFGPYRHYATREEALRACKTNRQTCAGLLEHDNWQYKDDYPYNLR